jgi:hypothetical protein
MATNDAERELQVFFFEKILLICKEIKDKNKLTKTNSISIKKKRRASLQLKGKIFIASIIQIVNNSKNGRSLCQKVRFILKKKTIKLTLHCLTIGVWSLKVFWRDAEMESFSLKCRNEEQLKMWEAALNKVLQDNKINGGTNGAAKRNVSNTQLASLAHLHISPRNYRDDDDAASFIDEEEEDEDESEEYSHDDEEDERRNRSRSNSINPYGRPPTRTNRSESSASDYHTSWRTGTPPVPSSSNSRHYNNMPGMTLPPLPKANPSASTSSSALTTPTAEYGLYPASPPPSNPSSPTTSSRASTNGNGAVRQRRGTDEASPLSETVAKFMMTNDPSQYPQNGGPSSNIETERPYPGSMGRAQSHSAASGVGLGLYSSSGTPPIPNAASISQTRLRSQSSPNIHRPSQNTWDQQQQQLHDMPINSRTIYNRTVDPNLPSPIEAGRVSPRMANNIDNNDPNNPPYNAPAATGSEQSAAASMRLKLNFHDNIYAIVVSPDINYQELMDKVGKKIRVVAGLGPNDPLRIKYQDEDGDLITINSDDDVLMGFESRGGSNTMNLFIS